MERRLGALGGLILIFLVPWLSGHAADDTGRADRMAVIRLIEEDLAEARTIRSSAEAPCFGTLDEIYPDWHGGDPTAARREWTFHDYDRYEVAYVVHAVHLTQPGRARAVGKRRVTVHRTVRFAIFPPERKVETETRRFTITCHKTPAGSWRITQETLE